MEEEHEVKNVTIEEIHDRWESLHQKWKKIFVASCLFAVLLDPLFLYVPIIKDDMKCMLFDRNLKIAAVFLRSVTDLFYIFDIIIQIYRSEDYSCLIDKYRRRQRQCRWKLRFFQKSFVPTIAKIMWGSYNILIDILAVLPLPQIVILIFFSKMRELRSFNTIRMIIMNFFALLQYVPRVLCIYFSCKELKRTPKGEIGETPIWIKGLLNFFMYILASHVLGAIWYFFAIQQMIVCWHSACREENGCGTSTFDCHDHHTSRNVKLLNNLCPINPPDAELFNFGIYTSVLQSGIAGSTNYFQKFSKCFFWGLQTLSSFGSNLVTSIDGWENLFGAFISIIGLLLFLYLIGNLQTYMQLDIARKEAHRHRMKMQRKMEEKGRETELWLSKNGVPKRLNKDMKSRIMEKVRQQLEENRDAGLDNILSILPSDLQRHIRSCMPMTRLKQVPMVQNMDEIVLKAICGHLKSMKYTKDDIIIEEGEQLEMMLLIVDGLVTIEKRDCSHNLQRGAGELCGETLLDWPLSTSSFPDVLPLATESAKAIGDVEALVLMARDLVNMVCKFERQYVFPYYQFIRKVCYHPVFVGTTMPRIFTSEELEKATYNYHVSRRIGEGGYAAVYKGVLPDKTVIAVKKFKIANGITESRSAINEAVVASHTNHINLVRLLGCCLEPETPIMLVFESISNGTLYDHLHKNAGKGSPPLSLEFRMKIAAETAGALAYLHSLTPVPIIHGEVTTMNILLDENYTAKLFDFRASPLVPEDEDQRPQGYTDSGTLIYYKDPQYFQSRILTEKSDVYSFGVVLAELLTSRKVICKERNVEESIILVDIFIQSVRGVTLNAILDVEITNQGNIVTVKKVANLAERCLRLSREERPSMKEVAAELEEIMRVMPKHPSWGKR